MSGELFDASKPDPIERLARIEGQSNFLSLLAGIEAGADTTQDMAALSYARSARSADGKAIVPEALEAYVAQSEIYRLPLMSRTFDAICEVLKPKPKELRWMRCATADGFLLVRQGYCKPGKLRAKSCRVDYAAYIAVRKLAQGVLMEVVHNAADAWKRARFSNTELSPDSYNGQ